MEEQGRHVGVAALLCAPDFLVILALLPPDLNNKIGIGQNLPVTVRLGIPVLKEFRLRHNLIQN